MQTAGSPAGLVLLHWCPVLAHSWSCQGSEGMLSWCVVIDGPRLKLYAAVTKAHSGNGQWAAYGLGCVYHSAFFLNFHLHCSLLFTVLALSFLLAVFVTKQLRIISLPCVVSWSLNMFYLSINEVSSLVFSVDITDK